MLEPKLVGHCQGTIWAQSNKKGLRFHASLWK